MATPRSDPPTRQALSFRVASEHRCTLDEAWRQISTPALINRELAPLVRMTFPATVETLSPETVRLGERICRSWILLFGVIPVDYDDVTLEEIWPGIGFQEASPMATQHVWRHRRTLEAVGGSAGVVRITDQVEHVPRWRWLGALLHPIYVQVFRHRHRRLARLLARRPGTPRPTPSGERP